MTRPDPPCFKSACFKSVPRISLALSLVTPHYQKRQNFFDGPEIPESYLQAKGTELGIGNDPKRAKTPIPTAGGFARRNATVDIGRSGQGGGSVRAEDRFGGSVAKATRRYPAANGGSRQATSSARSLRRRCLATTSSECMAAKLCTVDGSRRPPSETRSVRNCYTHSDTSAATGLLNNATRASLHRTPVRLA